MKSLINLSGGAIKFTDSTYSITKEQIFLGEKIGIEAVNKAFQ